MPRPMPRRRSRRAPTAVLVAALAFTSACGGGGAAGRRAVAEVRVGVLASLSSPGARAGRDALRGAELAANVVNTARPGLALPLAAGAGLPRLGGAKVAIVPGDTAGDPRTATALSAGLLVADGYTVAASVHFDPAATDLRGPVEAVRAADPDAVLAAPTAASAGVLLEAFRAVGYRPPALLVYDAQAVPADLLTRAGPAAVGLCRPVAWSAELAGRNPLARSIAAAYQQRFQEPMTEAAARGFTAVLAAVQAVDEAGSTGPDQVRTALLALDVLPLDVVMPWNGIHFDATRQNSGAGAVVEQYVGGRFQVVYPPDMTVHDLAWPAATAR